MQRARVGLGIDRDGAKAHALGRPRDAARDLAAIGDQERGEGARKRHGRAHILKTPKREGAGGAFKPAEMASASTMRVSAGSMMPSSQSRAVA